MNNNLETMKQINPFSQEYWNIPLIGISPDGIQTKVRINDKSGKPCVWGWSVWKRKGGYRTLGLSVEEMTTNKGWKFYQEE